MCVRTKGLVDGFVGNLLVKRNEPTSLNTTNEKRHTMSEATSVRERQRKREREKEKEKEGEREREREREREQKRERKSERKR